jgi:hypothetical protein
MGDRQGKPCWLARSQRPVQLPAAAGIFIPSQTLGGHQFAFQDVIHTFNRDTDDPRLTHEINNATPPSGPAEGGASTGIDIDHSSSFNEVCSQTRLALDVFVRIQEV